MALERLRSQGGKVGAAEDDLVAALTSNLAPSQYADALKQYVKAGMPAKF